MCYPCGSVDLTVKLCPMCKVFPHPKCPHRREICRNRTVHPRFDVLYLKNAEVESFNGCGWCKWAGFVQQKDPAASNNGWPGCCRPPQQCEFKMISAVDWKAVNTVFNVPIPPDVRHVLDTIAAASPALRRGTPPPAKPSSPPANGTATPPRPATGSRANSFSREKTPTAIAIPSKGNKGSPKQNVAALGSVRSAAGSVSSSSPKSPSTLESHHGHRQRQPIPEFGEGPLREKRSEGTKSSQSSPSNTSKSLESEIAAPSPRKVVSIRRNSAASSSVGASFRNAQDVSTRRRSPMSSSPTTRSAALANTSGRTSDQQSQSSPKQSSPMSATPIRNPKPREDDTRSNSGNSDGPSGGSGSLSDSTVTSDGGFTDYLSDESEAELQRQAEARAALLAQNQMEEMEFRAVRQRLAHVDLRPPKSWNPTNITNTGSMRLAGGSKV